MSSIKVSVARALLIPLLHIKFNTTKLTLVTHKNGDIGKVSKSVMLGREESVFRQRLPLPT